MQEVLNEKEHSPHTACVQSIFNLQTAIILASATNKSHTTTLHSHLIIQSMIPTDTTMCLCYRLKKSVPWVRVILHMYASINERVGHIRQKSELWWGSLINSLSLENKWQGMKKQLYNKQHMVPLKNSPFISESDLWGSPFLHKMHSGRASLINRQYPARNTSQGRVEMLVSVCLRVKL